MPNASNLKNSSIAISQAYKRIKSGLQKSNTPEGFKIQEIMNKLDVVLTQNYDYAVRMAYEGQGKEDREKDIAEIYTANEKMLLTEHQLKRLAVATLSNTENFHQNSLYKQKVLKGNFVKTSAEGISNSLQSNLSQSRKVLAKMMDVDEMKTYHKELK